MSWFYYFNEKEECIISNSGIFAIGIVVLALMLLIFLLRKSKEEKEIGPWNIRKLVVCSGLVLLSVIATVFPVYSLRFDGSVTAFGMFFICVIGYFYGVRVGVIAGLVSGLLKIMLVPSGVDPIQIILDYALAAAVLGFSGFFANSKDGLIKGYLIGVWCRYVCLTLCGWIYFGQDAWLGVTPFQYALLHNGGYTAAEAIFTIVVITIPVVHRKIDQVKETLLQ